MPTAQAVTRINARYYREMRIARSFSTLHYFRAELIAQARDHRATALAELGIRDRTIQRRARAQAV